MTMLADRQLQGAIFKMDGTSYLVLQENRWDSEQLTVRSIDAKRQLKSLSRRVIEAQLNSADVGITGQ